MPVVRPIVVFFVITFASRSQCYKNGYSLETCDSLIPNQEEGEANITSPNARLNIDVKLSTDIYRRNRNITIQVLGRGIEGFQLQVRKEGTPIIRIGKFVNWPEEAKPLQCDNGKDTAITHIDLEPKSQLAFTWQAPKDDEGELIIVDAHVNSNGYYWIYDERSTLSFAELPPSLKDCGKVKSCVRSKDSKDDCDGNTCRYLATYEVNNGDVEFSFSTTCLTNCYSAIGIKEEEDGKIDMTACIKDKDGNLFITHYYLEDKEAFPVESTLNLNDPTKAQDGLTFWCEYKRPFQDAGTGSLDFSKKLHWIYMWGEVNDTSNTPILGLNWYEFTHNISSPIDKSFPYSSSNVATAGFMLVLFSLLFSLMEIQNHKLN